jgi:hypothetical protein
MGSAFEGYKLKGSNCTKTKRSRKLLLAELDNGSVERSSRCREY